jgi:hypothetical protein
MFEKVMFIEKLSDHVYYGVLIKGPLSKSEVLYSHKNVHILDEKTHYVPSMDILEILTDDEEGTRNEALLKPGEEKEFEFEKDAIAFVTRQKLKMLQKNILNVSFIIEKEKKKYVAVRVK